MSLPKNKFSNFDLLAEHVGEVLERLSCPAGALYVIHNDRVAVERYWGEGIGPHSQFNIHSARKSYIGLAVALLLHEGKLGGVDDLVRDYFPEMPGELLADTTLRNLLTHTHGLTQAAETGAYVRVFPAGTDWAYTNAGVNLLIELVKRTSGQTVAELLQERVFTPLGFRETGWRTEPMPDLVPYVRKHGEPAMLDFGSDDRNLFVSARELAAWGHLHLKKGLGILPPEPFTQATSVQSPPLDNRQNGFCWWLNENKHPLSELGENLPPDAYQILGVSGCLLLVIPSRNTVAVRLQNKGGIPGFEYLPDVKAFGNRVMECLT